VQRYVKLPHQFVCLTSQRTLKCDTIPLVTSWKGWWAKLELFRSRLFAGPVAYFDLDTVLVSDITDIVAESYDFACPTNWKGGVTHISSAVMMWDGRIDNAHIFGAFKPAKIPDYEKSGHRWGDQGFIQDHLKRPFASLQERWPGRFVHTKTHIWKGRHATDAPAPKGASVVCFSGKPRPHELPEGNPLLRAWNGKH
jgi:hypothetical protein